MNFKGRSGDLLIAALFLAGTAVLLLYTAPAIGYSRAEASHVVTSQAAGEWLDVVFSSPRQAVQREVVERYWLVQSQHGSPNEHGSIMKLATALVLQHFEQPLSHWLMLGSLYRLPGILLSSLAMALIFLAARRNVGRSAAVVGALSVAFIPGVFHDSHLASAEMASGALGVTSVYCYARAIESSRSRWAIATALACGALWHLQPTAWLWLLVFFFHFLFSEGRNCLADLKQARLRVPRVWAYIVVIAPLVLILFWPYLWFDTWSRLIGYLKSAWLSGTGNGDSTQPGLTMSARVPAITLLLSAIGVGSLLVGLWRAWESEGGLAQAASGAVALPSAVSRLGLHGELLWLLGLLGAQLSTSLRDGSASDVLVWTNCYLFLGPLVARGFDSVCRNFTQAGVPELARVLGRVAVGVSALAGPLVMVVHSHPFGRSFHSALLGGAPGAANLGLRRSFSGTALVPLNTYLNAQAGPSARIYAPQVPDAGLELLRDEGRLRDDLLPTPEIGKSDLAPYVPGPNTAGLEARIWLDYGLSSPSEVIAYEGVPIVWVYERLRPAKSP